MTSALDEWTRRSTGNDAIDGLTERNRLLRERVAKLEAALIDAEQVMAKHIYPKPDVDDNHPYSVLKRVRAAIHCTTLALEANE